MNAAASPASPAGTPADEGGRHQVRRVRHELVRRAPAVQRVERLSPGFLRVTVGGPELAGFISLGFDDHVKLFFPDPSAPDGTPVARDYTPRRFDPQRLELDIDFALHGEGPAVAWAAAAGPGDRLQMGGPRGSMVIPMDFDGYVLAGDGSAWPAIARRLTELPAGAPVRAIVDVDSAADIQPVDSAADVRIQWLHGDVAGAGERMAAAIAALDWPAGEVHCWAAGETQAMRTVRAAFLARGVPKAWVKAAGYWRQGAAGAHEPIDD